MTIKPDNLKVEMVGTNATTVRLTHLPTRVIVQVGCYPDVERNRQAAMDGLSMALFGIYSDAGKLKKV